jgi:hypothetical protein
MLVRFTQDIQILVLGILGAFSPYEHGIIKIRCDSGREAAKTVGTFLGRGARSCDCPAKFLQKPKSKHVIQLLHDLDGYLLERGQYLLGVKYPGSKKCYKNWDYRRRRSPAGTMTPPGRGFPGRRSLFVP